MKVSRASIWLVLIFTAYIALLWWGDRTYRVFDDLTPFIQLAVTSRKIARPFYKQMRVAFVPPFHNIQGRSYRQVPR